MFSQVVHVSRAKSLAELPLVCHAITKLINTNVLMTVEPTGCRAHRRRLIHFAILCEITRGVSLLNNTRRIRASAFEIHFNLSKHFNLSTFYNLLKRIARRQHDNMDYYRLFVREIDCKYELIPIVLQIL